MELAGLTKIMEFQKEMIASGIPSFQEMVSPKTVWNAATRFARKVGFKAPEMFFEDPEELAKKKEEAKAQRAAQGIPEPEEPPSPEAIEAKAKMEFEQMKAGLAAQQDDKRAAMDVQKFQAEAQMRAQSEERAHQLALMKLQQEAEIAKAKIMAEMTIARERLDKEAALNSLKDQVEAQKMALENEWTKIEMRSSDMKRASEERQAELSARETAMREQNDAAKIASDQRAAELEALTAERTFQLEQQRLALEARKLGLEEEQIRMAASTAAMQPSAGGASGDQNAQAMMALAQAMTESMQMSAAELRDVQASVVKAARAKKRVVRDEAGKVLGVETVDDDEE